MRQGAEAGRANAQSLANRGFGSGVQAGAVADSRNKAINAGANVASALLSPQAQASNALTQANVYSPAQLQGGGLNALFGIQNQANNQRVADAQYNASRPPSFLETMLGVGGQVLPYILNQNQPSRPSSPTGASDWTQAARLSAGKNLFGTQTSSKRGG
jgi:hypothetical protein